MGCGAELNSGISCCQETCPGQTAPDPRPNPLIMALRFAAFGLGTMMALTGMIRERKVKHLAAWLGAWGAFLTLARYIICSRCEGYGKMCYSYYIGKYTSLILPRVEGKEVSKVGFAMEAACLGGISWIPALALRGDRRALMRYLAIMNLVMAAQVFHACRWCAANSTHEWKNRCPAHRTWKKVLKIS